MSSAAPEVQFCLGAGAVSAIPLRGQVPASQLSVERGNLRRMPRSARGMPQQSLAG